MKTILLLASLFFSVAMMQAQTKVPTAAEVLQTACKQATEQHKNVFVIFHASWCGWCKKMDASINNPECKKLFNDHYLIVHLTVHENGDKKDRENSGADEILQKINAFEEGIPVWLVYDKDGKLLSNSFMETADGKKFNIGCPASKEEVAAFVKILKATSPLSDEALTTIAKVFRKNEMQ